MMREEKPGWKKRALDELRNLSLTVMYMWVLLSVVALHREVILRNYHINYTAKFGFAFINAVILAKFIWLGEILHAGKKAARKALLYSMLWNSALFSVILTVCRLLEEALIKVWHGQSFAASFSETVADPRDIFASMLLMLVALIPFFFAKGLIEILGKDEIKRLF
jgi:Na+-driven multidrug efflux pump